MVGRRGKRGAAAHPPATSTRSTRRASDAIQSFVPVPPVSRGRGGRGGRGGPRNARNAASNAASSQSAPSQQSGVRPSLILKLRVRPPMSTASSASEESQPARPSQDNTDPAARKAIEPAQANDAEHPLTPRRRRSKRALAVPQSSRTTRSAARHQSPEEMEAPHPSSPTNQSAVDHDEMDESEAFEPLPTSTHITKSSHTPDPSNDHGHLIDPHQTEDEHSAPATSPEEASGESTSAVQPKASISPRASRKRKTVELKEEPEINKDPKPAPVYKRLKLKHDAKPTPQELATEKATEDVQAQPQPQTQTPDITTADEDAVMTDVDADAEGIEAATGPAKRGRGSRGGFRGRTRGRGRGRGGRGGNTAPARAAAARARGQRRGRATRTAPAARRGGKKVEDEIWEADSKRRSPSPNPQTKQIKERQDKLAFMFKKVGSAQQLALGAMADQNMSNLAKDKHAHEDCPEWAVVKSELDEELAKHLATLSAKHKLKTDTENRLFQAEVEALNMSTNAMIKNVQDEMFHAVRGKVIELMMGQRAAEDDEHTETDGSTAGSEEPQYLFATGKPGAREVVRGFDAEAVRQPDGAEAYDRAFKTWEDFVKKVRMENDVKPQLRALASGAEPDVQDVVDRSMQMLLEAAQVAENEQPGAQPHPNKPAFLTTLDGAHDEPVPHALSSLAEIALAEAMQAQPLPHLRGRALLPPQPSQAVPPPGAGGDDRPRAYGPAVVHPPAPDAHHAAEADPPCAAPCAGAAGPTGPVRNDGSTPAAPTTGVELHSTPGAELPGPGPPRTSGSNVLPPWTWAPSLLVLGVVPTAP
ncbi:uncharacterized protein N7483_001665 [Penicillium malachiteum]|uniref:uncharacterized protein n=1 Tax=Penicillium malachiteum TaxID=1324776 RepID=UPI002548D8E3|nr:uncharacterized protein N7483_001665 [Penicillium malachiteum]KAJ5736540.1 hypothetical protein N7483_001665 [Penicillium malachiteum]